MRTKADELCEVAAGQIGVTEDPPGSNRNPYGAEMGMNGVPWCCQFVWWCARQVGLPFPDTAYVPTLETWGRDNGYTVPVGDIRAGDVVCLDFTFPMGDGSDHVEIACGPVVNGWIDCVGGNTSDKAGGSVDNGGGVFRNRRPVSWVATAIRLPGSDAPIGNLIEGDDMSLTLIPTVLRPVQFDGRDVLDCWISPSGVVLGKTQVASAVVILPADPNDAADGSLTVDVFEATAAGAGRRQTVTVHPAGTAVDTAVGGRVAVVFDPARPVLVHGREVHFTVAS